MSFDVIGCILCGSCEVPRQNNTVSEAYRPWCPNNTGFNLTCKLCREFERVQDEIKEASQYLSRLLERRHQLNARISLNHCNNPLQRIPPEVLSNIFQFFVSPKSVYTPLKLGSICRGWRAIAWSTPRLWNSIFITFYASSSLGNKIQLTREWLSRSGQLPLSITIEQRISCDPPSLSVSLLSALVHVINGYANRWKDLDIKLPPQALPFFHADPHGKSILHTLEIFPNIISPRLPGRIIESFNATNPCPSPMVVKVLSVHFRSIGICWDKVTHLEIRCFSLRECFDVLRHAPSLKNCRFSHIDDEDEDNFPLPETVIHHPTLTSLDVRGSGSGLLLHHIALPSLQFLSVESCSEVLPSEELLAFLRRSSPPLDELHLSVGNDDSEFIIQILNETPSLKIFHQDSDDHDPGPLFQRLADSSSTLGADGPKFLPQLETMVYIGDRNFPWDSIPKIFDPTWRPLSKFCLRCYISLGENSGDDCIDETTLSKIQELNRRGISIEITDAEYHADFLEFSRQWLTSGPLDLERFLEENYY